MRSNLFLNFVIINNLFLNVESLVDIVHPEDPMSQPIGLPALLRKLNSAHVLQAIRAARPVSRSQVAKVTGLSQPTVNQIVVELITAGLVLEETGDVAGQPAKRGRPGSMLSFNSGAGHVLGLDIGAENVIAMVADLDGKIIARESRAAGPFEQLGPKPLLCNVLAVASTALVAAGVDRRELMAVGVGVPGSVDPVSGAVRFVPALPNWEGLEVAKELGRSLTCPVLADNDMHLAILAECRFGVAREIANAVYLHVGVGIGLGILIGGQIYTGADGYAGEIAFLPIGNDKDPPEAGFGQFEWAAGSMAIARQGRRLGAMPKEGRLIRELVCGDLSRVDAKIVFEAASRDDSGAKSIVHQVIERLCEGVCAINCTLNPGILILGGELMKVGDSFLTPLLVQLANQKPRPVRHVTVSSLGDDVVALGAVQRALRFVDERHFASPSGLSSRG
jgi:predicted NBD/HSP70 family sugar kinase